MILREWGVVYRRQWRARYAMDSSERKREVRCFACLLVRGGEEGGAIGRGSNQKKHDARK